MYKSRILSAKPARPAKPVKPEVIEKLPWCSELETGDGVPGPGHPGTMYIDTGQNPAQVFVYYGAEWVAISPGTEPFE